MPLYQEMVRRTIQERCPGCEGRLGIFDYGAGPFVRCENNCGPKTWQDVWQGLHEKEASDEQPS